MDKILTEFGVQPVYLAAQVVNFIILLLILKRFLYKPILEVLEDRKNKASDILTKAEQIEIQLQSTEQKSAEKLAEASKQAQLIINNATHTAKNIVADAHQQAQADVEAMIDKAREHIALERENMKDEMRRELASLVMSGLEKLSGHVIGQTEHTKIVSRTIKDLERKID